MPAPGYQWFLGISLKKRKLRLVLFENFERELVKWELSPKIIESEEILSSIVRYSWNSYSELWSLSFIKISIRSLILESDSIESP